MALEHAEWYLLSPGYSLGSLVYLQPISQLHKLSRLVRSDAGLLQLFLSFMSMFQSNLTNGCDLYENTTTK